ncbi:protein ENHANCED DISEASE RESISTANCE 2 isoform X3 [Cornus florida]|uniref:protein ENHANCED DISEASE RESISTANCE 2 isoform X3 n=1 Tax=Cornus florida TaxID=4283 RepID=UPI0028A03D9D|nr:protein ENHANCED DISEASE RESISTANCE 2 isoform X3 [Cornus florida]
MANPDDKNDHEWMERVKSGGAVPLLEPDNCANGWASPSGDIFKVRGPDYFSSRVKIPGGEYLLKPLGFDWIKSSTKISEVLNNPKHRVRRAIDEEYPTGDKPLVWAFNLQVPSKDNYCAVAYFVALEPIPEGSLIDQFLKGNDAFRNSRLKLIANIVKGPWIVRKAVGEQAICVIGRALTCKYCIVDNFIEVDIDIGSSMVASAIVHVAFGYLTTLTVDLAFLIEGQTESELPERILGASSLSTRLLKSIGKGFSNLIHPGVQESSSLNGSSHVQESSSLNGSSHVQDSSSLNGSSHVQESSSLHGSSHVNGVVNHAESNEDIRKW